MDTLIRPAWWGDFPSLGRALPSGVRWAFLDSAASAQKPACVVEAMRRVLLGDYANIHRGLYHASAATTAAFEAARGTVAGFFGGHAEGLVWVRNATEGVNLVAATWGVQNLRRGDVILLSMLEHHAKIVPWQLLCARVGCEIAVIGLLPDGSLDMDDARAKLATGKVKLVAVTAMSNVLGVRTEVRALADMAHAAGAKILVDGAQAVVHGPVDVRAWDCDWLVWTGHKLYGPTGVGVVWGRAGIWDDVPPYMGGGDMIETVSFSGIDLSQNYILRMGAPHTPRRPLLENETFSANSERRNKEISYTTFAAPPARFEAGTPAIAEVIGLATACEYVRGIGWEAIRAHEGAVAAYLEEQLAGVEGLVRYGVAGVGNGIVSFNLEGCHHSDVAVILDQCGVSVRSGHHCAMPLMAHLGVVGTLRASVGIYTVEEDVRQLLAGLVKARKMLR